MNVGYKETCCPIFIFFIYYICNEQFITFTSLKMRKTPYFYELIV